MELESPSSGKAALLLDEGVGEWEALPSTITAPKPFINRADIAFQVLRSQLCKCQPFTNSNLRR